MEKMLAAVLQDDVEQVISHRFPQSKIHDAVELMGSPNRNKVMILP